MYTISLVKMIMYYNIAVSIDLLCPYDIHAVDQQESIHISHGFLLMHALHGTLPKYPVVNEDQLHAWLWLDTDNTTGMPELTQVHMELWVLTLIVRLELI